VPLLFCPVLIGTLKDGAVVAIGDYDEMGRVRLFEFDSRLEQWILVGEVHAENEDDQFGVALSLAGGRGEAYLAIEGPNKKHLLGNPGFATTYKTTFGIRPSSIAPTEGSGGPFIFNFVYLRVRQTWYGEKDGHIRIAGNSVALSGDGNVFAYGLSDEEDLSFVSIYHDVSGERPRLSGIEAGDEFGNSISLSSDGLIMAVGVPNSTVGTVEGAGSVKVYKYNPVDDTWTMMGDDIVNGGSLESGRFGHSVSLNGDGDVLAIGSPLGSRVSIFRFENAEWVKMGDDITVSEYKAAWHGWSVSLSSDGLVVAVGGPTNEDNWDEAGACRIYEFVDNNSWQLRGKPILGEERHGLLGTSVSLSGDGNTVAVGAVNYGLPDIGTGEDGVPQYGRRAGVTFVYQYSPEADDWTSLGKPIFGDDPFDRFGTSVSLTEDGRKLAVGAPEHGYGGHVRLFVFDEEHSYWDE